MEKPVYSVVVPVFNEELVITESYRRLTEVMEFTKESYELIFINDGSRDKTQDIIESLCAKDSRVKLIQFSRNFGHQPAITAGMDFSSGDAVIIIDADLQDPPQVMLDMIKEWKAGYEVVYGKRRKRQGETAFKKFTAKAYYRLLRSLTSVDIPTDTGDFRLMDRKVVLALRSLGERNRYVRGLVSWVGFKQKAVEFDREERFAGETKYPLKKMIKLAMDGITAFSYAPLKLSMLLGIILSVAGVIAAIIVLIMSLTKQQPDGIVLATAIVVFCQGLVLLMLGVIGEFLGRMFDEIKGRPVYIVSRTFGLGDSND